MPKASRPARTGCTSAPLISSPASSLTIVLGTTFDSRARSRTLIRSAARAIRHCAPFNFTPDDPFTVMGNSQQKPDLRGHTAKLREAMDPPAALGHEVGEGCLPVVPLEWLVVHAADRLSCQPAIEQGADRSMRHDREVARAARCDDRLKGALHPSLSVDRSLPTPYADLGCGEELVRDHLELGWRRKPVALRSFSPSAAQTRTPCPSAPARMPAPSIAFASVLDQIAPTEDSIGKVEKKRIRAMPCELRRQRPTDTRGSMTTSGCVIKKTIAIWRSSYRIVRHGTGCRSLSSEAKTSARLSFVTWLLATRHRAEPRLVLNRPGSAGSLDVTPSLSQIFRLALSPPATSSKTR